MTPYYSDAHVTLYHGDMRELLPELGPVDAVVADPPYGETSLEWDRWPDGWPALVATVTNSLWCFGSAKLFGMRWAEFTATWRYSQDIVMRKTTGAGLNNDRFRRVHEPVYMWYRGRWADVYTEPPRVKRPGPNRGSNKQGRQGKQSKAWYGVVHDGTWVDDGTRIMQSVVDVPSMRSKGIHPTEKPAAILDPLIRYSVPPGGVVLDPFAGSASTLLTARSLGRRAVGIEAHEPYCEAAAKRLDTPDLFGGAA